MAFPKKRSTGPAGGAQEEHLAPDNRVEGGLNCREQCFECSCANMYKPVCIYLLMCKHVCAHMYIFARVTHKEASAAR